MVFDHFVVITNFIFIPDAFFLIVINFPGDLNNNIFPLLDYLSLLLAKLIFIIFKTLW